MQKLKIAISVPEVFLTNCQANEQEILKQIQQAAAKNTDLICFPELCISGATCGDLFRNELLLTESEKSLQSLLSATQNIPITVVAGLPICAKNGVHKTVIVFSKGKILSVVPTALHRNEKCIFEHPAELAEKEILLCGQKVICTNDIINIDNYSIRIADNFSDSKTPADIVIVPTALPAVVGQANHIHQQMIALSAQQTLVFVSAGFGESTTDSVFAGQALIASDSKIVAETELYALPSQMISAEVCLFNKNTHRHCELNSPFGFAARLVQELQKTNCLLSSPFLPQGITLNDCCREAFEIQTQGLITRLQRTGIKKVLLGISGGLDSTLALLVCTNAFDKMGLSRNGIIGITMPGFGTTGRTYQNAVELIKKLGVSFREINIKNACMHHFNDINHNADKHDAVYENAQARERTQILMDIANAESGLVVGTGDLSELALGWATYGGDHLSMYGVNAGVPKTMVRNIVSWAVENEKFAVVKNNLRDVIDTPVSPELLPANDNDSIAQKTEDLVGPYELHDFFLYYLLHNYSPKRIATLAEEVFAEKYDSATIKKWLRIFVRRFFTQQFKRSCMPDGMQVFGVSLSPRTGFAMPSDAQAEMWLKDLE